jgi:glycosyltransferase involved in cell wall biosynthesis
MLKIFKNKLTSFIIFFRLFYRFIRSNFFHKFIKCSNKKINSTINLNIEVIGFFESYSGIGESARLCAKALKKDGFKVKCTSVEKIYRKSSVFKWPNDGFFDDLKPDVRIFHLNPPMLPLVIFNLGIKCYAETYNIGYWAWELQDIPNEWKKAIRYVNAVFTPSDFSSAAIQQYTTKPVITVMHPVTVDESNINYFIREKLNISSDTFLISSIFSFGSAIERKNPNALIDSFKLAYQDRENVKLILKSNSGTETEKEMIFSKIANDKRICLIDEVWSKEQILGLINDSNLYASFHRSEGFGLTLAEALMLKVPVISTNWSGNIGFCNDNNGYLVNHTLISVCSKHPEFVGLANQLWAEIDQVHAAELLSNAYSDFMLKPNKFQDLDSDLMSTLNIYSYSKAFIILSTPVRP